MSLTAQMSFLFSFFMLNMNGGGFISDGLITTVILFVILAHVVSIAAYYFKITWLRVLCGILYLPVFLVPFVMFLFLPASILLYIPLFIFYYYFILRERKDDL